MSRENPRGFVSFVLLEDASWDKEAFMKTLKEDWQIEDEGKENTDGNNSESCESDITDEDGKDSEDRDVDSVIFNYHGAMVSVALMPGPIPEGEAEYHAGSNYLWKDAVVTSKKHKAHLIVMVLKMGMPVMEAGELLAKVVSTCCKQKNVLGVYTNDTVFMPEMYIDFAEVMKEDMFPIFNLVWLGLYRGKKGMCAYTVGLANFGYDEIEILESAATPQQLRDFLTSISLYVIQDNVVLRDGETIGFTADEKLPITKSKGVAVEGESLKIGYMV